ncbi:antibiotic biosynthesis monooxygenase [Streptomyces sp. NBC_00878]|uniref:antibiotic biosynthesis monooxygenase family protein n=1 Tax=Streptomyces sp. NBC_00878 TaxID=2975854 RepID=UPI0022510694|nr:antibiotic biosynthesis monooxygenase [Streptomyces sp. NBC_00878]MCX4907037.1 antibiotic biosynthesis monooxygenase [Streptomyces sp. NBC_00878]
MSDHPIAPVADGASVADVPAALGPVSAAVPTALPAVVPVAAHEPPYYAVVFTSVKTEEAGRGGAADGYAEGYGETAERMEELVKEIPGFLGMDLASSPGGLTVTVGYFRDADAIEEWRSNVEHRAAQKRGRAEWYERYTLHVAKVERSHGFEREHG